MELCSLARRFCKMAFFDLLKNCSDSIPVEKLARLVSIAFVRGSQSVRTEVVLIAAMISFGSTAAIAQDKADPLQKPSVIAQDKADPTQKPSAVAQDKADPTQKPSAV